MLKSKSINKMASQNEEFWMSKSKDDKFAEGILTRNSNENTYILQKRAKLHDCKVLIWRGWK